LYTEILQKNIKEVSVQVLPGVKELLHACSKIDQLALGVVTGNYEETGLMKIEKSGLDPSQFTANAWGTDGSVRAELPPVAIGQHSIAEHVVLIGDTVHDVTSGQAAGCRVIAVCTGSHDRVTLSASKPDLLLEDLSETEAILHWIFNTQTP
jgi:phosphoglycolate phosphatase